MTDGIWLHERFDFWARSRPEAEFVTVGGSITTFAQAAEAASRLAGAFEALLDPGDRFGILSKNSLEMSLLYLAGSKSGVVPVPLNYRLAPPEWEYILDDAGCRLIFAEQQYLEAMSEVCGRISTVRDVIGIDGAKQGEDLLDELLARSVPIRESASVSRRRDDALQIYTSGTSGRPKGAVLSQRGLSSLLDQWSLCFPITYSERVLVATPMYHVGGAFHAFHAMGHGASMYLMADFDAAEVVRALDEENIGMGFLVPSMIQSCLQVPGVDDRDYRTLRFMSYGSSPISETTLRRSVETFGCDFVQAFGMTECPNITYLSFKDHRRALAGFPHLLMSAGLPGPGSQVMIVDGDGQQVGPNVQGEILGRGPQLMGRYWNLPEETKAALSEGWMRTGDMGMIDEEGYLYVLDRIKDMIVSGGENIYPREVEDAIFQHPSVADAAVIGVPDERWGEAVKGFVVLKESESATGEELIEFCASLLARYKRPRTIEFIDAIPRNASGKALKRVLREPYWRDQKRGIS